MKQNNEETKKGFVKGFVMKSKAWQLKEWKDKREGLIKNKDCAICHSTNTLIIHHKKQPLRYRIIRQRLCYDILKQKIQNDEIRCETIVTPMKVCPNCKHQNYYARDITKPKYRCNRCHFTFDEPEDFNQETKQINWLDREKFRGQYSPLIHKMALLSCKKQHEEYMDMNDTVILCKRCHFLLHKGWKLCPKCKEQGKIKWIKPHFDTCFDCLPKGVKKKIVDSTGKLYKYPCGRIERIDKISWSFMGSFEVCHECEKLQECKYLDDNHDAKVEVVKG